MENQDSTNVLTGKTSAENTRPKNQKVLKTLLLLLLLTTSNLIRAQEILWSNTYLAGSESHGYSIKNSKEGGFYIGGSASISAMGQNIYILKIDANGDTLWTKNFGGIANDEASCIVVTEDSGCIVAGYTQSYGSGSADFFIVKLDKNGTIQWTRTNGGALDDKSYTVINTMDGGYLVTGYTSSSGAGGRDIKVVKLNSGGTVQWTQTIGGVDNESAYSACQMFDSSYIIAGTTTSFGATDQDIYLLKLDTRGDTLWTKVFYNEGSDFAYSIYACAESGFVVAGKTNGTANGDYDMLLMKFYDDGNLLWKKKYGDFGDQVAYDVKETKTFGFVLGGATKYNTDNVGGAILLTTSDFGDSISQQLCSFNVTDVINSIAITATNDIAFVGTIINGAVQNIWVNVATPCIIGYPRGIWFGNSWQFNSNKLKPKTMLIDTNSPFEDWRDKMARFITYCVANKMATVILNNLEDIFRLGNTFDGGQPFSNFPVDPGNAICACYPRSINNCPACTTAVISGDTLRNRLKVLVSNLHHAGVRTVLAQWLDQTRDDPRYDVRNASGNCATLDCDFTSGYTPDEDAGLITNNLQILDAFITHNTNADASNGERFDGIMCDYEYFAPHYKDPLLADPNYSHADEGFINWKNLIDEYNTAKLNSSINGIRRVQAYLNYVCFMDGDITSSISLDFDGNQLWEPEKDTRFEISEIDDKNLDAVVLAYYIKDQMQINPTPTNNSPLSFLTGVADGNNTLSWNDILRIRLKLFGHDANAVKTNIIPIFRAVNSINNCATDSWLGNYLLGNNCYWTNEHFLADVENEFFNQYNDPNNIHTGDPEPDYGTTYPNTETGIVNIYQGFQWFQYGLNDDTQQALTYDSNHSLRMGDVHQVVLYDICNHAEERTGNIGKNNSDSFESITTDQNSLKNLIISPNPFSVSAILKTPNNAYSLDAINIKNVEGKDVTSMFSIEKNNQADELVIVNKFANSGTYIFEIKNSASSQVIKFSILK